MASQIVKIDETLLFKRKYNRGRVGNNQGWVFGGLIRGTTRCFAFYVPDRTRMTLEEKISQFILPGSLIISDGWRAYGRIGDLDDGIYEHSVIIHDNFFVDPLDRLVHTQGIEGA